MFKPKIETFYSDEAQPVIDQLDGPVESFIVLDEKQVLEGAIGTGDIEPGAFRQCAVFGDGEGALGQKKVRYESKRAKEVQAILDSDNERVLTPDDLAARIYIDQYLHAASLVEASRKYNREVADGTLTAANARLYGDAIDTSQDALYPRPDRAIAVYAAQGVMDKVLKADPSQFTELLERYPFMADKGESVAGVLSDEKRVEWHDYLHDRYDSVFKDTYQKMSDEGIELTNSNLPRATFLFAEAVGLPMSEGEQPGWKVVEREDVAGFRIEPGDREIICGRRKQEIKRSVFEQLMLHEVGVHATRAEYGFAKNSRALQTGLPGSAEAEEGLAITLEGLWLDKPPNSAGRDQFRYLAVCYADGTLDGEKHSESESYAFITDLIAAQKAGGLHDEERIKFARKTGYEHVKRAFRGMPEGKVMRSNLSYLAGRLKMAEYLQLSSMPPSDLLPYLQQGKFNPTDERHTKLVAEI